MFRIFAFFGALTLTFSPLYAQRPSRLDGLVARAEAFRELIAAGNRARALEFVVSAGRDDFLNNPVTVVQHPRLAGIDFVQQNQVQVRIAGKFMVSGGAAIPQLTEMVISDVWVWDKNNWYFQPALTPDSFGNLFAPGGPPSAATFDEIKSSFKLLTPTVEVGKLELGERRYIRVPFEYTGAVPLRLEAKSKDPVTALDTSSTRALTGASKEFGVWIGSDDFSGPFAAPLIFTIFYKDVSIDHTVTFNGVIQTSFEYRQIPEVVPVDSNAKFQLIIRNNTTTTAEISAVFGDAKFVVDDFPMKIPAGAEAAISLRRIVTASPPGSKIEISLKSPINGRDTYEIKVR